jgi:ribosome-associated protein
MWSVVLATRKWLSGYNRTMLEITPDIFLDERELTFEFIRASGPGGQNVNKVATAVQLRFDAARSACLPEAVRARLMKLAGKRVTSDGVLVIEAKKHRSQEQNRFDALERFRELLRKASEKPKTRRKTKPTKTSKEERLKGKKKRGEIKKLRTYCIKIKCYFDGIVASRENVTEKFSKVWQFFGQYGGEVRRD